MEVNTVPARKRWQPDAEQATNCAPPSSQVGQASELALLTLALGGEKADALLEGLASSLRPQALATLQDLRGVAPAVRQARLSHAFGTGLESDERVRTLMSQVGPRLQGAIFETLPLYQKTLFPRLRARTAAPRAPWLEAWAQRLSKEARA